MAPCWWREWCGRATTSSCSTSVLALALAANARHARACLGLSQERSSCCRQRFRRNRERHPCLAAEQLLHVDGRDKPGSRRNEVPAAASGFVETARGHDEKGERDQASEPQRVTGTQSLTVGSEICHLRLVVSHALLAAAGETMDGQAWQALGSRTLRGRARSPSICSARSPFLLVAGRI